LSKETTDRRRKFRGIRARNGQKRPMSRDSSTSDRAAAVARAQEHSPFLRDSLAARPEIADAFLKLGANAAVELALQSSADNLASLLRRRRQGLALAVALGDLSSELTLEQVTRFLSDFADSAIDQAVHAAITERVPDA